jgi:LCP family protein required for cell wall assembly
VVVTLAIVLLVGGGWLGWKFIYNAHKLFGGSVFSIFTSSKLKGEDVGRVNILLAGDSADDPGHEGANLTDSIMLLSINTRDHTAFMLSIPRDLYVKIPGDGYQKINAANVYGDAEHFSQSGYPAGGMGLLEKTVEQRFGVDINYYALINYNAFKDAVNAVGGIDIDVQSDDPRGLYDPSIDYATNKPLVRLSNGWHHLSGQQALDLARARGDAYGAYGFPQADFDRTAHQRQMLLALKSKASSAGVVTNPIRLGQLFDAVGHNVKTDFTASNIHRLYDVTKGVDTNSIKSISLNDANGKNLLQNYQGFNGESALAPAAGLNDYSQIQAFLRGLTSNNPVVKEAATVAVLNATDSYGLAAHEQKILQARYINVTQIGDANANRATTLVIDNTAGKKPATKQLLQTIYGTAATTVNPYTSYHVDFIIVVGADRAPPS